MGPPRSLWFCRPGVSAGLPDCSRTSMARETRRSLLALRPIVSNGLPSHLNRSPAGGGACAGGVRPRRIRPVHGDCLLSMRAVCGGPLPGMAGFPPASVFQRAACKNQFLQAAVSLTLPYNLAQKRLLGKPCQEDLRGASAPRNARRSAVLPGWGDFPNGSICRGRGS